MTNIIPLYPLLMCEENRKLKRNNHVNPQNPWATTHLKNPKFSPAQAVHRNYASQLCTYIKLIK